MFETITDFHRIKYLWLGKINYKGLKMVPSIMLPFQWEASVHSGQTPWLTRPGLFAQADEWRAFLSANYLASKLIKSFLYSTSKLHQQIPLITTLPKVMNVMIEKIMYKCKHHILFDKAASFNHHILLIIVQIDINQYLWCLIDGKTPNITGNRSVAQTTPWTSLISHNAPLSNRCAHFCFKMAHCGIFV